MGHNQIGIEKLSITSMSTTVSVKTIDSFLPSTWVRSWKVLVNIEKYLLVTEAVEMVISRVMCGTAQLENTWKAIETSQFYSKIMLRIFLTSQLSLRTSGIGEANNSDVKPSHAHH